MDAKDLRTEPALSERSNDGNANYPHSGPSFASTDKNKSYHDIGSNSLPKVDVPTTRPCAVIGPDRIIPPPQAANDPYIKRGHVEPWQFTRPPEYPHKMTDYQNVSRNISPRQTFQENMQRIMVPPRSHKLPEDVNFSSEKNVPVSNNATKISMPTEAKYCDVPYSVNPLTNEPKSVRSTEHSVSNVNPTLMRGAPHGWPPTGVNVRGPHPYRAPDPYHYPDYTNCAAPRAAPVIRPLRTGLEDPTHMYPDPYRGGNIRYEPYPAVKERNPIPRYEYFGNYSNPYPPLYTSHKYDVQKLPTSNNTLAHHPYPGYTQVPLKYLREPLKEGYQRSTNPQANYNVPYNQNVYPNYGSAPGNCLQSKVYTYPSDSTFSAASNAKSLFDMNGKPYVKYDNIQPKPFSGHENLYLNEVQRSHMKPPMGMPGYQPVNMHPLPPYSYYRKDNMPLRSYDYANQYKHNDPSYNTQMSRIPLQYSPNIISPVESNVSNDNHSFAVSPEDCGYVSQSSTTSVRSTDSMYRVYDPRYGHMNRASPITPRCEFDPKTTRNKDKRGIDVRQFLQMWNEGEEEHSESHSNKDNVVQTAVNEAKPYEVVSNQDQLYVLGLVNVPSEELSKYEHIQKVSKLPENIKGYTSIDLLNQFEEAIESSNINDFSVRSTDTKPNQNLTKSNVLSKGPNLSNPNLQSRPLSPLDVEAKISQSVIHKEVGCNFEIRPCSPKMLNVEVAAPPQTFLEERAIEKVSNRHVVKSPQVLSNIEDNTGNCHVIQRQDRRSLNRENNTNHPSCKMIKSQYSNDIAEEMEKADYTIQDLESNSGVCLASLPRLDNDIELSFPEVNQQFINANKAESVITTSCNNLPLMEATNTETVIPKESNEVKGSNSHPFSPTSKEFTKLSKYRKVRGNKESQQNALGIRTDSVIIKNPENNVNIQEFKQPLSTTSNPVEESTNNSSKPIPINLAINNSQPSPKTPTLSETIKNCFEPGSEISAINLTFNPNAVHTNSDFVGKIDDSIDKQNNEKKSPEPGACFHENVSKDQENIPNCTDCNSKAVLEKNQFLENKKQNLKIHTKYDISEEESNNETSLYQILEDGVGDTLATLLSPLSDDSVNDVSQDSFMDKGKKESAESSVNSETEENYPEDSKNYDVSSDKKVSKREKCFDSFGKIQIPTIKSQEQQGLVKTSCKEGATTDAKFNSVSLYQNTNAFKPETPTLEKSPHTDVEPDVAKTNNKFNLTSDQHSNSIECKLKPLQNISQTDNSNPDEPVNMSLPGVTNSTSFTLKSDKYSSHIVSGTKSLGNLILADTSQLDDSDNTPSMPVLKTNTTFNLTSDQCEQSVTLEQKLVEHIPQTGTSKSDDLDTMSGVETHTNFNPTSDKYTKPVESEQTLLKNISQVETKIKLNSTSAKCITFVESEEMPCKNSHQDDTSAPDDSDNTASMPAVESNNKINLTSDKFMKPLELEQSLFENISRAVTPKPDDSDKTASVSVVEPNTKFHSTSNKCTKFIESKQTPLKNISQVDTSKADDSDKTDRKSVVDTNNKFNPTSDNDTNPVESERTLLKNISPVDTSKLDESDDTVSVSVVEPNTKFNYLSNKCTKFIESKQTPLKNVPQVDTSKADDSDNTVSKSVVDTNNKFNPTSDNDTNPVESEQTLKNTSLVETSKLDESNNTASMLVVETNTKFNSTSKKCTNVVVLEQTPFKTIHQIDTSKLDESYNAASKSVVESNTKLNPKPVESKQITLKNIPTVNTSKTDESDNTASNLVAETNTKFNLTSNQCYSLGVSEQAPFENIPQVDTTKPYDTDDPAHTAIAETNAKFNLISEKCCKPVESEQTPFKSDNTARMLVVDTNTKCNLTSEQCSKLAEPEETPFQNIPQINTSMPGDSGNTDDTNFNSTSDLGINPVENIPQASTPSVTSKPTASMSVVEMNTTSNPTFDHCSNSVKSEQKVFVNIPQESRSKPNALNEIASLSVLETKTIFNPTSTQCSNSVKPELKPCEDIARINPADHCDSINMILPEVMNNMSPSLIPNKYSRPFIADIKALGKMLHADLSQLDDSDNTASIAEVETDSKSTFLSDQYSNSAISDRYLSENSHQTDISGPNYLDHTTSELEADNKFTSILDKSINSVTSESRPFQNDTQTCMSDSDDSGSSNHIPKVATDISFIKQSDKCSKTIEVGLNLSEKVQPVDDSNDTTNITDEATDTEIPLLFDHCLNSNKSELRVSGNDPQHDISISDDSVRTNNLAEVATDVFLGSKFDECLTDLYSENAHNVNTSKSNNLKNTCGEPKTDITAITSTSDQYSNSFSSELNEKYPKADTSDSNDSDNAYIEEVETCSFSSISNKCFNSVDLLVKPTLIIKPDNSDKTSIPEVATFISTALKSEDCSNSTESLDKDLHSDTSEPEDKKGTASIHEAAVPTAFALISDRISNSLVKPYENVPSSNNFKQNESKTKTIPEILTKSTLTEAAVRHWDSINSDIEFQVNLSQADVLKSVDSDEAECIPKLVTDNAFSLLSDQSSNSIETFVKMFDSVKNTNISKTDDDLDKLDNSFSLSPDSVQSDVETIENVLCSKTSKTFNSDADKNKTGFKLVASLHASLTGMSDQCCTSIESNETLLKEYPNLPNIVTSFEYNAGNRDTNVSKNQSVTRRDPSSSCAIVEQSFLNKDSKRYFCKKLFAPIFQNILIFQEGYCMNSIKPSFLEAESGNIDTNYTTIKVTENEAKRVTSNPNFKKYCSDPHDTLKRNSNIDLNKIYADNRENYDSKIINLSKSNVNTMYEIEPASTQSSENNRQQQNDLSDIKHNEVSEMLETDNIDNTQNNKRKNIETILHFKQDKKPELLQCTEMEQFSENRIHKKEKIRDDCSHSINSKAVSDNYRYCNCKTEYQQHQSHIISIHDEISKDCKRDCCGSSKTNQQLVPYSDSSAESDYLENNFNNTSQNFEQSKGNLVTNTQTKDRVNMVLNKATSFGESIIDTDDSGHISTKSFETCRKKRQHVIDSYTQPEICSHESNSKSNVDSGTITDTATNVSFNTTEPKSYFQTTECPTDGTHDGVCLPKENIKSRPCTTISTGSGRRTLKRSLSESALYYARENPKLEDIPNWVHRSSLWPNKRKRIEYSFEEDSNENDLVQNRRNSISSIYHGENVSFCILIDDNCIITEEGYEEEEAVCFADIQHENFNAAVNSHLISNNVVNHQPVTPLTQEHENLEFSETISLDCASVKDIEENWVEDVACVETVVSDDIVEDDELYGDNRCSSTECEDVFDHTDKIKNIYGEEMCSNDMHLIKTLYSTPQMDVNKTLHDNESLVEFSGQSESDCKEDNTLSSHDTGDTTSQYIETEYNSNFKGSEDKTKTDKCNEMVEFRRENIENIARKLSSITNDTCSKTQDNIVHSCDAVLSQNTSCDEPVESIEYKRSSSSPEVSSTTSEDKKSGILLKITNYNGSRVSQINDINLDNTKRIRCKFTEDSDYLSGKGNSSKSRPLITKAAQKYIPPLKETIRDLKVKLFLPEDSLIKLKKLKVSKETPKLVLPNKISPEKTTLSKNKILPKKHKPKFEDVLKSIDEVQAKMRKEKTKKVKKPVPKVIIKKTGNGSYNTSTLGNETYNPDLTGRKWQPWVFIERNKFIDKMASKGKKRAVFCHRKKTYILAENFQKFRSVGTSTKLIISQPKADSVSPGPIRYTIKLKQSY